MANRCTISAEELWAGGGSASLIFLGSGGTAGHPVELYRIEPINQREGTFFALDVWCDPRTGQIEETTVMHVDSVGAKYGLYF